MSDARTGLVGDAYDRIADRYTEWQALIEDDARGAWTEDLAERLDGGARILELGCGAGLHETRRLAGRFDVTAVDISAQQIERARVNASAATFVRADLTELELAPASFEAVVSLYVFNHVPRELLPVVFGRVHRWLVPGGWLLVTLGASDLAGWTGEWLGETTYFSGHTADVNRRLLTDAGFALERDELVTLHEPEGDVAFHWILARS